MPRVPRTISQSGYQHVYTRGAARQILFEERGDYVYFLQLLKRFSLETRVTVCAFCLMENHIHLLAYDPEQHISRFMQLLGMTYAGYFNWKYQRSGPLFESRFKSIPIESEDYLLTAFRYVLNNPRKAGICSAAEYPWSSYSRFGEPGSFVDTSVFQDLLESKEQYEAFISAEYDEDCPELEGIRRDDAWAQQVIRETPDIPAGNVLQGLDREARDKALRLLKKKGLSIRQIERLTGINRNAIQRA